MWHGIGNPVDALGGGSPVPLSPIVGYSSGYSSKPPSGYAARRSSWANTLDGWTIRCPSGPLEILSSDRMGVVVCAVAHLGDLPHCRGRSRGRRLTVSRELYFLRRADAGNSGPGTREIQ